MGQDKEWPAAWAAQIGARIRELRDVAGLSAQKLSTRCEELGFPIPRSTIANIESGRKESIPVHEVSVIAKALDVPPLAVLFPIDQPAQVHALPGQAMSAWAGWQWFSGQDKDLQDMAEANRAAGRIGVFLRAYQSFTHGFNQWTFWEGVRSDLVALEGPDALARHNPHVAESLTTAVQQIAMHARTLQRAGLELPVFPPKLAAAVEQALVQMESEGNG